MDSVNTDNYQLELIELAERAYRPVWEFQRYLQQRCINGEIADSLIYVEHDPVYTIGKNGSDNHVIASNEFLSSAGIDVVEVDRGGDVTYHGPGQLVGYPIFDLRRHTKSISWYMRQLEEVFIRALQYWGIESHRIEGQTGVWIGDGKIVALGVRISRWVTMHGFAFNVDPEMSHFNGIIPCGIFHKGVTSLREQLGFAVDMVDVRQRITEEFCSVFGFEEVLARASLWENWLQQDNVLV